MSVDLMACKVVGETEETFGYKTVPAGELVAWLCMEAGVCLCHDPLDEEQGSNYVEIEQAIWDITGGLVVTDRDGKRYQLRMTAKPLPPCKEKG